MLGPQKKNVCKLLIGSFLPLNLTKPHGHKKLSLTHVCVCVLTWTVCHLLESLLLTAASTQVEDTLVSLQSKIKLDEKNLMIENLQLKYLVSLANLNQT